MIFLLRGGGGGSKGGGTWAEEKLEEGGGEGKGWEGGGLLNYEDNFDDKTVLR